MSDPAGRGDASGGAIAGAGSSSLPDAALVAILVCPITRTSLRLDAVRAELVADTAGLAYPIRNGVPVLIAEAARRIGGDGA